MSFSVQRESDDIEIKVDLIDTAVIEWLLAWGRVNHLWSAKPACDALRDIHGSSAKD